MLWLLRQLLALAADLARAGVKRRPLIRFRRTEDRRWIAEYQGVLAEADTRNEAARRVLVIAARCKWVGRDQSHWDRLGRQTDDILPYAPLRRCVLATGHDGDHVLDQKESPG